MTIMPKMKKIPMKKRPLKITSEGIEFPVYHTEGQVSKKEFEQRRRLTLESLEDLQVAQVLISNRFMKAAKSLVSLGREIEKSHQSGLKMRQKVEQL